MLLLNEELIGVKEVACNLKPTVLPGKTFVDLLINKLFLKSKLVGVVVASIAAVPKPATFVVVLVAANAIVLL